MKRLFLMRCGRLIFLVLFVTQIYSASINNQLIYAATRGDVARIQNLLNRQNLCLLSCLRGHPNINYRHSYFGTPLNAALCFGHVGATEFLLNQDTIDASPTDNTGKTTLHMATCHGFVNAIAQILQLPSDRQPDINAQVLDDNKKPDGRTALFLAIAGNRPEIALLLLQQPTIDASAISDTYGILSVLHVAAAYGYEEVAEKICTLPLDRQPDIYTRCKTGETALEIALTYDNKSTAHIIKMHMVKRLVHAILSDPSINISEEELLNRVIYRDAYRVPSPEEACQVIVDLLDDEYKIKQAIHRELDVQFLPWSSEDMLANYVTSIRKIIIGKPTAESIHQAVMLYLIELSPELASSQTNAFYCGNNCWLTQHGYNFVKEFTYRTHQPMSNATTLQPIAIRFPVRSIDALLRLENSDYDIDAIPLHDPVLYEEFVVSKDELIRIANHLCTHHKLAALSNEEIEHLRGEADPQMYIVRALTELLQQKIRTQDSRTQEKSSATLVPAEEVILMLHQEAHLTMEQVARVLPLLGNPQQISLQRVQWFIKKRLEIIQQSADKQ